MPEQGVETGEAVEAEEVLDVVFPSGDKTAEVRGTAPRQAFPDPGAPLGLVSMIRERRSA